MARPNPNAQCPPPGQRLWSLMLLHRLHRGKEGRWHSLSAQLVTDSGPGPATLAAPECPGGRRPLAEDWGPAATPWAAGQVGGWRRSWSEWVLRDPAHIPPLGAVMPTPPPVLGHCPHPKLCPSLGAVPPNDSLMQGHQCPADLPQLGTVPKSHSLLGPPRPVGSPEASLPTTRRR